jgi:hypothetical protein
MSLTARSMIGSPIVIGIRQRGVPYRMLWDATLSLTSQWKTYNMETFLEPEAATVGLWLQMAQGQVDLKHFQLERISGKAVEDQIRAQYPDGGPANILPWSRLPLGLASGWTVDRHVSLGDDFVVEGDPLVSGEADAPVLKIDASKRGELVSAPFKLAFPLAKHVFRFRARGLGEWTSALQVGKKDMRGNRSLELQADKWTTFEIPFDPEGIDAIYFLRWEGQGTLWLDQLQVGPENKVHEGFAPAGAAELALSMKAGDASHVRVHFDDESPALRYLASGDLANARLKGVVINAYGEERALPELDLSKYPAGEIEYAVFPDRNMGPMRVEAHIERDGKRLSPIAEWVAYRLPRPKYWGKDAPDSPFGVHMYSTRQAIDAAKAVGANWTRLHDAGVEYIGWYNLEPEPGKWRFFDKEIKRFRDHGIMIYGQLGTAPGWASYFADSGKSFFHYWDKYFQIKDWDAYRNYVKTVVERYKDDITVYCVWNEPWIHAWFGKGYDPSRGNVRESYVPSETPQKDFAKLMQITWDEAKKAHPQVTITGFNTTSKQSGNPKFSISGEDWTRGVLEEGGLKYSDVIDYHMYASELNGFPGDYVERGLKKALGPIFETKGKVPVPVWMSEGSGSYTIMDTGFYNHTLPWDVQENPFAAANAELRYILSQMVNGVDKIFLYSMGTTGVITPDMGTSFATLTGPDGWMHPAGAAHAIFARLLEDKEYVERVDIAPKVHAYLFSDGSQSVAVVSTAPGFEPIAAPQPEGAQTRDLFGNPIRENDPLGINLVYVIAPGDATSLRTRLLTNR